MSATLLERHEDAVTIQIRIPLSRSLLDTEQAIQQALNEAGLLATTEALRQFDTAGSPLQIGRARTRARAQFDPDGPRVRIGPARSTGKGQEPKGYQTPWGGAAPARHVYQT